MVFGWVRKLFKKKKRVHSSLSTKRPVALVRAHTFHTSNVPPASSSDYASPISSRLNLMKARRKRYAPSIRAVHNLDDIPFSIDDETSGGDLSDSLVPRQEPRVVNTPSRIATLTKRDYQRIFNHQFDVSKIPEKVPTWKTSRPYEQQAAHFKFRMSGRFHESDASTIRGGGVGVAVMRIGFETSKPASPTDSAICNNEPLGRFTWNRTTSRQSDLLFDDSQSAVEVVEEGDLSSSPEISTFSI